MSKLKIGCFVLVLILAVVSVVGYLVSKQGKAPSSNDAMYQVVTSSRIYLTNELTEDGTVYYLHGYFVELGGKWVYKDKILPLDQKVYGEIKIKVRPPSVK